MKCANPRCGKEFTPPAKRPQQQFHNAACRLAFAKMQQGASIELHRAKQGKRP